MTLFKPTILSLYDASGVWSSPYKNAGYNVIQIDLVHGQDARLLKLMNAEVYGILAAPPCDRFSKAGMHIKRTDAELIDSLSMVDAVFRYVHLYRKTLKFWAIENPPGRLTQYLGEPDYKFQPSWFGADHTKLTYLWGRFNSPRPTYDSINRNPVKNHITSLAGNNPKHKAQRQITPKEFAKFFYIANP